MADRPVRIITKQTSVPSRVPTGTTGFEDNLIRQGEMAQNTFDKKLFGFDGINIFEFGVNSFLSLTGGTITGNTRIVGNLSANTIISGSTDLYQIFATSASIVNTYVQPGTNTYTGGTDSLPTVNISALTINTLNVSGNTQLAETIASSFSGGTVSGGTFISGGTDLYGIFHQKNGYLLQKQGSITGSTFSGNPKKVNVAFVTPFPSDYAITVIGEINRTWTIESKTTSGFTINSNSNVAFDSSNVFWIAGEIGEGYR